jgi:hypothetical protein
MRLPINVKSHNNISEWHMEFYSAFKGLNNDKKSPFTFILLRIIAREHYLHNKCDLCKRLQILIFGGHILKFLFS